MFPAPQSSLKRVTFRIKIDNGALVAAEDSLTTPTGANSTAAAGDDRVWRLTLMALSGHRGRAVKPFSCGSLIQPRPKTETKPRSTAGCRKRQFAGAGPAPSAESMRYCLAPETAFLGCQRSSSPFWYLCFTAAQATLCAASSRDSWPRRSAASLY